MELSISSLLLWELCAIALAAGMAHGVSGFGFPLISTPFVALLTDVRTAVMVTLLPNIAVNLISVIRGGNWSASLVRYWPVPLYVMIGTILGTRLILVAPPEPLKLLLAAVIAVYLKQDAFRQIDWSVVNRRPHWSGLVFGLLGGVLSGSVNVALPPLIIYFTTLGLAPLAMTQILNLCFLAGRGTQVAVFTGTDGAGMASLFFSLPAVAVAIVGVLIGGYCQSMIQPAVWRKFIRAFLWTMTAVLIAQTLAAWSR